MTSYSTLVRKAKATKNPAAKRRLMNQANKLRRASRRNGGGTPDETPETTGKLKLPSHVNAMLSRDAGGNLPGQGEIVGAQPGEEGKSPLQRIANDGRIATVIKHAKKGEDFAIGITLRAIAAEGMDHGRKEAREQEHQANKRREDILHRRVIQDFLSHVRLNRQFNGVGTPGIIISELVLEHLEQALRKAGY